MIKVYLFTTASIRLKHLTEPNMSKYCFQTASIRFINLNSPAFLSFTSCNLFLSASLRLAKWHKPTSHIHIQQLFVCANIPVENVLSDMQNDQMTEIGKTMQDWVMGITGFTNRMTLGKTVLLFLMIC